MAFKLRCPVCRGSFRWNPLEGMPDICKLCGADVGHNRADDDVVIPMFRTSSKTKAIDQVYRDMEKGSEVRAQAAANMLGVPVSEMSSLKITNMKDNQRAGDIADASPAPTIEPQVAQQMTQNAASLATMGPYFAQNVRQGKYANRGAGVMNSIFEHHQGPKPNA